MNQMLVGDSETWVFQNLSFNP